MKGLLHALQSTLFPRVRCLSCNEPRALNPGEALCDACAAALETLRLGDGVCPRCRCFIQRMGACAFCAEGHLKGLIGSWAPFRYHSVTQRLVVQLKFGGLHLAAVPLVEGMLHSMPSSGFDALVPLALHKRRLRERGFDQAALLAQGVSKESGLPVLHALERIKDTKRQSGLAHEKRQDNMKDSFRAALPVKGLRLLLVDDVRTSGSSASAAAGELLRHGAREVGLLTATAAAGYSAARASDASS